MFIKKKEEPTEVLFARGVLSKNKAWINKVADKYDVAVGDVINKLVTLGRKNGVTGSNKTRTRSSK